MIILSGALRAESKKSESVNSVDVKRVVSQVNRNRLRRHISKVAVPRHHLKDPKGLEKTAEYIRRTLKKSRWIVTRELLG